MKKYESYEKSEAIHTSILVNNKICIFNVINYHFLIYKFNTK